jgi:hypothetical protein
MFDERSFVIARFVRRNNSPSKNLSGSLGSLSPCFGITVGIQLFPLWI